jgi:2-polyprenyl-6-methoxyphenol hydroxylase and related FAD-dependent oxidoreductases
MEIRADLIIGADGRHSIIQACAGLERQEFGVPIDALWMRISKKQDDPQQSLGFFQQGKCSCYSTAAITGSAAL